jgi:hypothetical protein
MEPTQEAAPSSTALLDALRKRLMPEVNAGAAQRLSDIGIGMLASGSPDFFTALGKGLQAGNTAETNRLQMLRQAAETEEQAADRKARLELQRRQLEYEQDPTNPRTRALLMQAEAAVRSADAAVARAGRENQGVFVPIGTRTENGVTGVVSQNNVTGAIRFEPNVTPNTLGAFMARQDSQQERDWLSLRAQARQELSRDNTFFARPAIEQEREISQLAERLRIQRQTDLGRAPGTPAAPAAQPTTRLNLTGPLPPRQPTAPTE